MAQEIVTWCDVHMRQDERVPGRTFRLSLEGPLMEIDLCEQCDKAYLNEVRFLLEADGRPVGNGEPMAPATPEAPRERSKASKDTRSDVELFCPACAKEGGSWSTHYRSKMRGHALRAHNEPLAAIESRAGVSVEGKELRFTCEACGLKFAEPQGLGTHRRKAHEDKAEETLEGV